MLDQFVRHGSKVLREHSSNRLHVYAHYDVDGLSSAAIMLKILNTIGTDYSVSVIKEVDQEVIKEINEEQPNAVMFLDIGSTPELLGIKKNIFKIIIDHHEPFKKLSTTKNTFYLNPMLFGVEELSNSGILGFLAKEFGINLPHIALLGIIGDLRDETSPYCTKIVKDAIELGYVRKIKSLRIFGHNTKPLVKALEHSYDPYIPGLSGNESAVVKFLDDLGISAKHNGEWVFFNELSDEEKKKLCSAIIMQRISYGHEDAEDIFGDYYFLSGSNIELREMATAVNAFGRLERYDEGIMFCLDPQGKKYEEIMGLYRKTVGAYLNWIEEHKNTSRVIEIKNNNMIINGGNAINSNFIGTICTILYKSCYDTVVGLAQRGNKIKVSGRSRTINIQKLFAEIGSLIGGSSGGHKNAAGMSIPIGTEERFINLVKQSLLQLKGGISGYEKKEMVSNTST